MSNLCALGSALTLGLTLSLSLDCFSFYKDSNVQVSIDTLETFGVPSGSQREELISEGFEPPKDEEGQPSRTVG